MAKLTPVIIDKVPNEFGEYNVKIRIGHKSKNAYLETDKFVSNKHLTADRSIKVNYILAHCTDILNKYNEVLKINKHLLPHLSHLEIKELLNSGCIDEKKLDGPVMFMDFCRTHIESVKVENTASGLRNAYYRLNDYLNGSDIPATEITSKFLSAFEAYLRTPVTVVRNNMGTLRERKLAAGNNTTINKTMSRIKTLFKEAKAIYNDEELGIYRIPNSPFKKYKVVEPDERKTDRDYTPEQIAIIRDCVIKPGSRAELARDIFMLSFYLLGMNSADLYNLSFPDGVIERVNYNRQKTRKKRKDNAFLSVNFIPASYELYHKYAGHLQKKYSHIKSLNNALHYGMKAFRNILGEGFEELESYSARHSVGSIAQNICGYSDEDVAKALNHVNQDHKVTRLYIRKSWAKIDEIQAAVVAQIPPSISGSISKAS